MSKKQQEAALLRKREREERLYSHALKCDECDFDYVCDVFKKIADEDKGNSDSGESK